MSLYWFLTLSVVPVQATHLAERMYGTQRARQVGDLVTVVISESTASSKREALTTSKESAALAEVGEVGDFNADAERDGERYTRFNENFRFKTPPYRLAASSEFSGDGSAATEETLSSRFTARIIDTLPNGVFVIRGEREVSMAGERMTMVLTGLARSQDIDADNTVASTRLADARIHYKTDGNVSNWSKPGWFWKIFQVINPF